MVSCKHMPLYKKGDRYLACNYRPVSLTFVPCKLLKYIVCSNIIPLDEHIIMAQLDEHKLLSDREHAVGKSIATKLNRSSSSSLLDINHNMFFVLLQFTFMNDWAKSWIMAVRLTLSFRTSLINVSYTAMTPLGRL